MIRERGVALTIVTLDLGMQARARLGGFRTHRLGEEWLLPPTLTPTELAASQRRREGDEDPTRDT
jgi:hypothetical protein